MPGVGVKQFSTGCEARRKQKRPVRDRAFGDQTLKLQGLLLDMAGVAAGVETFLLMAAFALHVQGVVFAGDTRLTTVMAIFTTLVIADMVAKLTTLHPFDVLPMVKMNIAQPSVKDELFRYRQGFFYITLRDFNGRARSRDTHHGHDDNRKQP